MTTVLALVALALVLVALALHDVAAAVRSTRRPGPCDQLAPARFLDERPAVCDLTAGHAGRFHRDRVLGTSWTDLR